MRSWVGLLLLAGCKQIFGLDQPARQDAAAPCAARDVTVGYQHSCMVDTEGRVLCWGGNDSGQANPGIAADTIASPTELVLPGPATTVGAGRYFSCALLEDGAVWCWGDNTHGQLGDGTLGSGGPAVQVPGLLATSISVGARYACARRADDETIQCWGDSRLGQAGYSDQNSPVPRTLAGSTGAQQIASGHAHTCSIDGAGNVSCWGRGTEGQLALGNFESPKPPSVTQATDVVEVDLGVSGGCVRHTDGGVSCWGILRPGDGTWATSESPRPTLVQNATKVAHGFYHACAIADGTVQCWGINDHAELGRGTSTLQPMPMAVAAGFEPMGVTVGDEHVCVHDDSRVRCWGHNERGQLGIGTAHGSSEPVEVAHGIMDTLRGIAAGARSTCVWTSTTAKCWGDNRFGQLGSGTTTYRELSPVSLAFTGTITDFAMGLQHACLVTSTNEVRCWGNNNRGQLGTSTSQSSNTPLAVNVPMATEVTAGHFHTCARTSTSLVACWGSNADGQLGDGTYTQRAQPMALPTQYSKIFAGSHHTCGITTAGVLQCWGWNDYGQLGIGTTVTHNTPQNVTNFPGTAVDLFGGGSSMCAINNTGNVYCWGRNDFGQLGDGTQTNRLSPTRIFSISVLRQLDIGILGGCGLETDGSFNCWGAEALRATGSYDSATPLPVDGASCAK